MTRGKESQNLHATIQNALKVKKYDGLLETVNRYLKLKPGDASARKLQKRLRRREKKETQPELHHQHPTRRSTYYWS